MVVDEERFAHGFDALVISNGINKIPIYSFGCNDIQVSFYLSDSGLLACHGFGTRGGDVQLGHDVFDSDVAGGIPAQRVDARVGIQMEEHVVQRHVQKRMGGECGLGGVAACERGGIEADVGAVGRKRGSRYRQGAQTGEGGVHEAQSYEQRVFGEVERLDGKRVDGFGCHNRSHRETFAG